MTRLAGRSRPSAPSTTSPASPSTSCVGVSRVGPWADQRARQDGGDGARSSALDGSSSTAAHRRPLPLRGGLARRVERVRRGPDPRVRQDRRRPRCAAPAAVRQRIRAQPLASRAPGPARRARVATRNRADHRQAIQADHPGKNERFHQTLFRYLDKQPLADTLADTLAELQAQVEAFDRIYNTERPHQGQPRLAWRGTPRRRPKLRAAPSCPASHRPSGPSTAGTLPHPATAPGARTERAPRQTPH